MIGIRRAAGVAVVLAALVLPRPANNAVEQTIIDTPISERERLEQMASRGEIRSLTMEITAYTDDEGCQEEWVGQTATGVKPHVGIVAIDPDVVPLHSKLYIEGVGIVDAKDTGGAIKGNKMDLFVNSRREAMEWGRQYRRVYILRNGRES